MTDVDERAMRVAGRLPVGFALRVIQTITNEGVVEVTYVLMTRAPESGRLSRRIGNVLDLDGPTMAPFDDAPWAAVQALVAAGWKT